MVLMSSVSQRPNHHNVQNNQINSKFICQLRKSETVLMLVATEYTLNTVYRSHTLYLSLEHCRMEWKMHNTVSLSLLFVCWIFLYVHIQQSSSNKLIKSNDTCQQVNNQQQKKKPTQKTTYIMNRLLFINLNGKWYHVIKCDNMTPDV